MWRKTFFDYRLKILWIFIGLVCMLFLLYGVEERSNVKSTTIDHNIGSTLRLASFDTNLGKYKYIDNK